MRLSVFGLNLENPYYRNLSLNERDRYKMYDSYQFGISLTSTNNWYSQKVDHQFCRIFFKIIFIFWGAPGGPLIFNQRIILKAWRGSNLNLKNMFGLIFMYFNVFTVESLLLLLTAKVSPNIVISVIEKAELYIRK